MANFLVVGGAGYVGSHVCLALVRAGHRVVVVDDLSTGHPESLCGVRFLEGGLGHRPLLDLVFEAAAMDAVIHLAVPDAPRETDDPVPWHERTVVPTLALLQAMRVHGVKRMIFGGSAEVYKPGLIGLIDENAPTRSRDSYSTAHVFLDRVVDQCGQAWGLSAIRLRWFNAAGAGGDGDLGEDHLPENHLIPQALQVAMGRKACVVLSGNGWDTPDGTLVTDYVHVEDVARAHVLAAQHLMAGGTGGVFNLGFVRGFSEKEVLLACRKATGKRIPQKARRAGGLGGSRVVRPDLAREVLGWEARSTDLDSMVSSAWEWHRAHPFGYGWKTRRWNPGRDRASHQAEPRGSIGNGMELA